MSGWSHYFLGNLHLSFTMRTWIILVPWQDPIYFRKLLFSSHCPRQRASCIIDKLFLLPYYTYILLCSTGEFNNDPYADDDHLWGFGGYTSNRLDDQFFLGKDMLVAPIVNPGIILDSLTSFWQVYAVVSKTKEVKGGLNLLFAY